MARPPKKASPKKASPKKAAPKRQSGDAASTIAAKVLAGKKPTLKEINTLAGSVLAQDETKGKRNT